MLCTLWCIPYESHLFRRHAFANHWCKKQIRKPFLSEVQTKRSASVRFNCASTTEASWMNCTTLSIGTGSEPPSAAYLPLLPAKVDGNAADPSLTTPIPHRTPPTTPTCHCYSRSGEVSHCPSSRRNCGIPSRHQSLAGWSWLWALESGSSQAPSGEASAAVVRSKDEKKANIKQEKEIPGMNIIGVLPAGAMAAYSSASAARVVPALSPNATAGPSPCLLPDGSQCASWSSGKAATDSTESLSNTGVAAAVTTITPSEYRASVHGRRSSNSTWTSPAVAMAAVTLMAMSSSATAVQEMDDSIPQTCTLLEISGNQGEFATYINGKFHIGIDGDDGLIANGRDAYQKVRCATVSTINNTCQMLFFLPFFLPCFLPFLPLPRVAWVWTTLLPLLQSALLLIVPLLTHRHRYPASLRGSTDTRSNCDDCTTKHVLDTRERKVVCYILHRGHTNDGWDGML